MRKNFSGLRDRRRRAQPLPLQYRHLLARVAAIRRLRLARSSREPIRFPKTEFDAGALSIFGNLPLRARLANQFTDAMIAMEEALSMCELERETSGDASWIEPQIKTTYDQVNALMKVVCD
jgi:hypothetical protein